MSIDLFWIPLLAGSLTACGLFALGYWWLPRCWLPLTLLILLGVLFFLNGCSAGFWRQCIDVDAKGLYSVSELGILGIGQLKYQRNTAQCKENESPEPAKLPEVKGPARGF